MEMNIKIRRLAIPANPKCESGRSQHPAEEAIYVNFRFVGYFCVRHRKAKIKKLMGQVGQ